MEIARVKEVLRWMNALIMMAALAWLTISLPYVNAFNEQRAAIENFDSSPDADDSCDNPLNGTTEEKTENNSNSFNELLHHTDNMLHYAELKETNHKCHSADIYYDWHPELNVPPPKA